MKVILFSRPQTCRSTEDLRRLFDAVEHHGFDYAINEEFARAAEGILGCRFPKEKTYGTEIGPQPDGTVMVCYGGDGTLLEGVHRLDGRELPVIGVNSGHLGFLAMAPKENIESIFDEIAAGNLKLERRSMLEISGIPGIGKQSLHALNESAVQRLGATMISINTYVDGQMTATYNGNGVIISTPTGSTAYSLSAGGPIITPACNCLAISPLSAHNLAIRPLVVPDSSEIRLEIDTRETPATVSADNRTYEITGHVSLTVKRAQRSIFLAVPHNISFYDTLRNKMMWGVDVRM